MTIPGPSLSFDTLSAFNDELSALVRAGVPIERGLKELASDQGGALGSLSGRVADRLARGESLGQAIEAEGSSMPPVYRAVVETGLASGRLPSALEGLAEYTRSLAEMRRLLGLALLYPLSVVVLAYVLFVGFVVFVAPRMAAAFESMQLPGTWAARAMESLGGSAVYWAPVFPIVLLVALIAWFLGGSTGLGAGPLSWLFRWLPGVRSFTKLCRASLFAELMAMLVDHGTPLDRALVLAGNSSGDRRLAQAAGRVSGSVREGRQLSVAVGNELGIPPLISWILARPSDPATLARGLRYAAASYRDRARSVIDWAALLLPIIILAVIGGGVTLLYAVALFWPLSQLLEQLGV